MLRYTLKEEDVAGTTGLIWLKWKKAVGSYEHNSGLLGSITQRKIIE
jgi:hypothetical protein